MTEQMNEQIMMQERKNTGTAWTRNDSFDKNGFLLIKNLWSVDALYHSVPPLKGQYNFYDKNPEHFTHTPVESQVEGSTSRYWHPQYRKIHSGVRKKLENIIGRKLYNTYYYDRFYYPGQSLAKHVDRDACEISVTVHVSTTLEGEDANWPVYIKTPDTYIDKKKTAIVIPGEEKSLVLKPGDGMVYKGCERPHWRNPMPGENKSVFGKKFEPYYHQIFFHYVLQDGHRAHCAWDRVR
tara:strand:- start:4807 stop:5520 length:714 start_codon:yes stop_codon:yes gene_type:complete